MHPVVVKVGTNVLASSGGGVDHAIIKQIVDQVAELKSAGYQVVLVSSGAVGAGRSIISLPGESVPEKQVYAAIGQARLMSLYSAALEPYGVISAQVLVSKEDFTSKEHAKNMKACLQHLVHDEVLPIVNENDVVAIDELLVTDNDELAGLVAVMLDAKTVFFLTSVDGILDAAGAVIPSIHIHEQDTLHPAISAEISQQGRGGMQGKYAVARRLAEQGIASHILNGNHQVSLLDAIHGSSPGTTIVAESPA